MSAKRKQYTPAQKAKIALEALKGEKTMSELSGSYEISSAAPSALSMSNI